MIKELHKLIYKINWKKWFLLIQMLPCTFKKFKKNLFALKKKNLS